MQEIKHIGIILDGNRRYAKSKGEISLKGHQAGAKKVEKFLDWCEQLGIAEVTLYALSIQNLSRQKEEVEYLFNIFKNFSEDILKSEKLEELKKKGVKIRFIGRRELLPKEIQELMNKVEKETKDNGEKTTNFAIAYGGREEIVDSVKKIAEKLEKNELKSSDINEQVIEENLYIKSEPQLIIRTGGVIRTSNFLVWQSNYSEWFFLEKFWPEIEKQDLIDIIDEFHKIERRFGK